MNIWLYHFQILKSLLSEENKCDKKKIENQICTDAFVGVGKCKLLCNIVGTSVQGTNYFIAISLPYSLIFSCEPHRPAGRGGKKVC